MTPIPAGWKPRLSCPFCGSTCLFTVPDEHGSGGQWVPPIHVGCNDCQAEQVADTEDEAVERWNRRSSPASVAPGDAQGELTRDRIEEIAREVYKVERFTKDDEVWHNLHWLTSFAKAIEKELRPAPAAGDARLPLPAKMPEFEGAGDEYPSNESYQEGYTEGWNAAINAAIAAQQGKGGE